MTTLTQPLRDEHQELMPHIERLRVAADAIGEAPPREQHKLVDESYRFLTHHLIPHAAAEEHALYPVIGRVIGSVDATRTMSRDHVEIGRLTEELGALRARLAEGRLTPDQTRALRSVLYGLYAVVRLHFAKEEEVYLPLLEARLSRAEAEAMFGALAAAAREAKGDSAMPAHSGH